MAKNEAAFHIQKIFFRSTIRIDKNTQSNITGG